MNLPFAKAEAVLIAGPTASGKTALAVDLAKKLNGVVINADSMQVYSALRLLTARPHEEEMQGIEHLLFGHVPPATAYSAAGWIEDAGIALKKVRKAGKLPVFAGGTGLYFRVLTDGLSEIPDIKPEIRKKWRELSRVTDATGLHARLAERDPEGAAMLRDSDTQRVVRALEVIESTGIALSKWQATGNSKPLLDASKCIKVVLMPPRALLHERINSRFLKMVESGALEEVRQLRALGLPGEMPILKAIGVSQLSDYMDGETSLEKACELAATATRQYAKRQSTWFRNQFGEGWIFAENASEILQVALNEN